MHNNIYAPARLLIGNQQQLEILVITQLQQHFCTQNACKSCSTCTQLQAKQFHGLLWLQPEKTYTLEYLEPIFEKISFTQEQNQHFFFVLLRADTLNTSCSNKLLKVLEEPPAGYHFILLTHRPQHVLATIRSRCSIKYMSTAINDIEHPICMFFIQHKPDPLLFMQTLESQTPSESESIDLIDILLKHYYLYFMKNLSHKDLQKATILQAALKQPPMTGSSKLFWRNLFVQWYT